MVDIFWYMECLVAGLIGIPVGLLLGWVLWLYITREIINDGSPGPYLIRYFVSKAKDKTKGRVYLHNIKRSDHDRAMHSHPWSFTSIILWGGYWEHTPSSVTEGGTILSKRRWYGRGSILHRPAPSVHRLELPKGKSAWSLVITGPKVKEWGFWIKDDKFCQHDKYSTVTGLCED